MSRSIVTAVAALMLLSGCATTPLGRTQFAFMPDTQLDQMGLQAFENIKSETPRVTDSRINNYVRCVAGALTNEVGGQWEVVVFQDDSANAFALPGGKVGVHSGLLKVAQNQHQLATVIGHEIAHVLARHSNERVSQEFAVQSGLSLIQAISAPTSATGQTLMGLLGVGAQYGVLLPYGRLQESEADILGLELMARAGFDPTESINLWVNMDAASRGQPVEFLSTHPSHASRIQDLRNHMPKALQIRQQAVAMGKNPRCN